MTNVSSGDALYVALVSVGFAFPILALLKNITQLGCMGRLVLPALIGSGIIITFSSSLTDISLAPVNFHKHWQHTPAPFNTFVVTTIFSITIGIPAALGASLLAFCGLAVSENMNENWTSYSIFSVIGTFVSPLIWSLSKKSLPRILQSVYGRYELTLLTSSGLLALCITLSQYEDLIAANLNIVHIQIIGIVGATFALIALMKQYASNCPEKSLPPNTKLGKSLAEQDGRAIPTPCHPHKANSDPCAQQLREVENRYRALVETCPDAIIIHANSTILFANSAAIKLLGHPEQKLLSDIRLCEFIPSDQRERFSRYVQNAMGGAYLPRIEERILPLHGLPISVEMCGRPITFNGVRAIQTLIKDISPQRRAEEALHEHHKQWHALLDNVSEAIMVLDIDNARIETANPNAQSLFGCAIDQAPSPHKIASLLCKMAHSAERGRVHGPKILPRADGGRVSSNICITRFSSYGRQKALVFVREAVPLPKLSLSLPWEKAPKRHPIAPPQHHRYPYIKRSLSTQGAHRPLSR